jgi:UDP-N-acetylglucosamine 2-epimerase
MKIVTIIGARPQIIKEAMLQKVIRSYEVIEHTLIHTGQHFDFDMSGVFFENLQLKKPDYFLGISGLRSVEAIAKMMVELEKVLTLVNPDFVIVYGDTNSTLAGAIAANKLGIKLAHVEAGLRQEPKSMPEESNRVITDHLSDFLFTPTKVATDNLLREQPKGIVIQSGDVMFDLFKSINITITERDLPLKDLRLNEYVLLTLHRDFNVDDSKILEIILNQIAQLSLIQQIVFPLHPRTKKNIERFKLQHYLNNVRLLNPVDYKSMLALIKYSKSVITDSGGLQKESYFYGKPAVILMPDTSWKELTDNRIHLLSEPGSILSTFQNLETSNLFLNFYGDGQASKTVIETLIKHYKL